MVFWRQAKEEDEIELGPTLLSRVVTLIGSTVAMLVIAELALGVMGLPVFHQPRTFPPQFRFLQSTDGTMRYLNLPSETIQFIYDSNPRGYFGSRNELDHPTNKLGFRGPDWSMEAYGERVEANKAKDTLRLAFLGDSFTFGEGVWFKDTYPEVVARRIRDQGRKVEAFNFGVGGYNTTQSLELLEHLALPSIPDAVVLGYVLNDAEAPLFSPGPDGKPVRAPRPIEEVAAFRPPERTPYQLNLARLAWKFHAHRNTSKRTVEFYHSLYADDAPGWVESQRALKEMATQCRGRGIPFVVVVFPILHELQNYPFVDEHEKVVAVAKDAGAVAIDLLPLLEDHPAEHWWVHPSDHHPNERAQAVAAGAVYDVLSRSLGLKKAPAASVSLN